LAEIDIDQAELAAGHERRERIDRLHDVAGQWQFEGGHVRRLFRVKNTLKRGPSSAIVAAARAPGEGEGGRAHCTI
jgi:hypothetical protein